MKTLGGELDKLKRQCKEEGQPYNESSEKMFEMFIDSVIHRYVAHGLKLSISPDGDICAAYDDKLVHEGIRFTFFFITGKLPEIKCLMRKKEGGMP